MSNAVLAVSIGPVQDFIAQARRSRDLWFGSHALSEIARAAASEALDAGAETLVFPAVDAGDEELAPCDAPLRADGSPPLNIGNVLLLIVPESLAGEIAGRMARAAVDRWRGLAAQVLASQDVVSLLADDIEDIWHEQIDSLLEVYAAVCTVDDQTPYAVARERCGEALAARKNLRDFAPWVHDRAGAPKSSFDGGRVSILAKPGVLHGDAGRARRRFRLLDGEQLDAVGLVKRCGGKPEQFVPLANVALASWIDSCRLRTPRLLEELCGLCEDHGVQRVARRDLPWLRWRADGLAYDVELLLADRLKTSLEEYGIDDEPVVAQFVGVVEKLQATGGRPPVPHVCCLVADGDRMGAALGELADPGAHREFSRRLAGFAARARDVVNQHGFTVYAGGDDVLGFVPPTASLVVAEKLRDAFAEAVAGIHGIGQRPTLSVGLGIGHIFDGMAHLLDLGRQAERLAKGNGEVEPRNALGIIVDRRSGGTAAFRGRWETSPADRMRKLARLMADRCLPMGKIYEIKQVHLRLPSPGSIADGFDCVFDRVLEGEVRRMLARAGGDASGEADQGAVRTPEDALLEMGATVEPGGYARRHQIVAEWVDACLVAREFRASGRGQGVNDG